MAEGETSVKEDGVLVNVRCHGNTRYGILVRAYVLNQYRIQLTDSQLEDPHAPEGHGQIVREMCTYREITMNYICHRLMAHPDPIIFCEEISTPWKCEHPGGRIRLDTTFTDREYDIPIEDVLHWVECYQRQDHLHSLTCGNDSNHKPLKPEIVGRKVVLKCEDCSYVQTFIPDMCIELGYKIATGK